MMTPPFHGFDRLRIVLREVDNRRAASNLCARLRIAVVAVDIQNELAVQQVQRNILWADA